MKQRNQGEYPGRLSLRVRLEDKHRLEEFAYKARRPNGYVLQRALDLYEAELERPQAVSDDFQESELKILELASKSETHS